jgi:K+ transporter
LYESTFWPRKHGCLTLGALGVVYGDIGTSPLYTMKEVFSPATGVPGMHASDRCGVGHLLGFDDGGDAEVCSADLTRR